MSFDGVKSYIVSSQNAIQKLQPAHHHQERHEGVKQLGPLRRRVLVVCQEVAEHLVPCLWQCALVDDAAVAAAASGGALDRGSRGFGSRGSRGRLNLSAGGKDIGCRGNGRSGFFGCDFGCDG